MKRIVSVFLVIALLISVQIMPVHALSTKPVVHLKFDGDLKDSSGNGYHGDAPDANIEYGNGVIGKAAKVDSAMITLLGSKAINWNKAFSLSVWLKLDPDVNSGDIVRIPSDDPDYSLMLATCSYGNTSVTAEGSFVSVDDPEWYANQTFYGSGAIENTQNMEKFMHLAIVYDGTTLKQYYDGKLDSTSKIENEYHTGEFFGNPEDLIVGGFDSYSFFHGYMDDLQVFNTAISFADVTELYKAGIKTGNNKMILTIDDPYMMVNGVKKEIDPGRDTAPIINDKGRTILPVKAVIESMGGTIAWEGSTRMVTIKKGNDTIKLWIDKDKAEVNGVMKEIDPGKGVVPEIINSRTMLPIRFVLEELGLPALQWNGALRQITITY